MDSKLAKFQPLFYHSVIEQLQSSKKVQHAYLIETHFVSNAESYILEFVETLFSLKLNQEILPLEKMTYLVEQGNYLDLKVLKTSNTMIKKEEILNLKQSFQEKSVYDGYQIYIIYEAEKLNSSSANTILKFLEEPEENIIAILVTNNRYQVLETILSRCQLLSFIPEKEEDEKKISDEAEQLIKLIAHRKQEDLLLSYKQISEDIYYDKNISIQVLNELMYFFAVLLKCKYQLIDSNEEYVQQFLDSFTEEEILKILTILNQKQQELQYNLNLKLWIDSFLLKLMEV